MGITVKEALGIGGLKNSRVVAGEKGLDRMINFVLTMDVPDAAKWIRGNELLLTAAYILKSNPGMEDTFIYDLVDKNCAALAIKLGRFINTIPPPILEVANKKNFPIIELLENVSWHDIVNPLMSEILNKEASLLKRIQQIHNELAGVILCGGGLHLIASSLSNFLNCPVFIEDESFNLISLSTGAGTLDELCEEVIKTGGLPSDVIDELDKSGTLHEIKRSRKPIRYTLKKRPNCFSRVYIPIIIKEEICGYLVLVENNTKMTDFDLIVAEQAALMAALEIIKNLAVKQVEGKVRREFLEKIVTGEISDISLITRRLKLYGINLKNTYSIIVLQLDYDNALKMEENRFKLFEDLIGRYNDNHIIFRRGDEVILVYSLPNYISYPEKYSHLNSLCKKMSCLLKNDNDIRCGVSEVYNSIDSVSNAYKEARKALKVMNTKNGNTGNIVFYKDVWIYDLLSTGCSKDTLREFCDRRVLKLIEYNSTNKDENLLNTFKVFLDNMGRHNTAAEKLYIHRNTLNYRLNKIKDILGCSLDDPSVRLRFEISLKIMDILENDISRDTVQNA